jgi:hypothetical protein
MERRRSIAAASEGKRMSATRSRVSLWRRQAAIAVALCLTGCNSGASNPAGPSTARQNLPALGNAPAGSQANPTVKRTKVTGKVLDAATGEPIEKVTVLLTSEPSAQAPALPVATPSAPMGSNPGAKPAPAGSNPMSLPGAGLPGLGGSDAGASQLPITPGAVPSGSPDVKPESFTTTTNNEGKFYFNGIPEGTMHVTFVAPKYRALSLANVDPTKLDDVSLSERNDAPRRSVKGTVTLANGAPLANAMVSPIFRPGQGFPMQVASDDKGQFLIDEITTAPRGFAALSAGANGQINTFSLVHPGDTKKEQKSWFDSLFKPQSTEPKPDAPVKLVAKAVTDTVDLSADIEKGEGSADDFTAKDASVFMNLNDHGDEALIARERVSSDRLHFQLPPLPGGASYHLQVRASGPADASSFHHTYGLHGGEKDTKVTFLPAPTNANAMVVKSDQGPTFSWDPVVGADLYRVQLDTADGETVWQGWTTKTSLIYPTGKGIEKLREKEPYVWTISAIKGLKGVSRIDAGELRGGAWTDLSSTSQNPLDFNGLKGKKPSAKPQAQKPTAVPSAASHMETKATKPAPVPAKPVAPTKPAAGKPAGKPAAKPATK